MFSRKSDHGNWTRSPHGVKNFVPAEEPDYPGFLRGFLRGGVMILVTHLVVATHSQPHSRTSLGLHYVTNKM